MEIRKRCYLCLEKISGANKNQAKTSFQKIKVAAKNVEKLHAWNMYIIFANVVMNHKNFI